MVMRSRVGRTVFAMLLGVATLTTSSSALAQTRGNSGLPAGSGNPMAGLQAQITTLQAQITTLQQQVASVPALANDVAALQAQMRTLLALQGQVNSLADQATRQAGQLAALGGDVSMVKEQMRTLLAMQAQLDAVTNQTTRQAQQLAALGNDVAGLKEQLALLALVPRQLAALSSQVAALSSLQNQVTVLSSQVEKLASQPNGATPTLGIYDKNGQRIGDVLGVEEGVPYLALKVGDSTVVLQVYPNQMVGLPLWFDGVNCSGNAWVSNGVLNTPSVFRFGGVLEPHGIVYAVDVSASTTLQRVTLQSMRESNGACTPFSPFRTTGLLVKPVFDLDATYERGYSVR
jgi:hypothetical protein